MRGMEIERHEAIGQRGEACIVLAKLTTLPNGEEAPVYQLATGERLVPVEPAGHFATLDGRRTFRLRRARPAPAEGAGSQEPDSRRGDAAE